MSAVYRIERLDDFLKVPADRLELCLSEVSDGIRYAHAMQTLANAAGTANVKIGAMNWTDDDKGEFKATISVTAPKNGAKP